MIVVQVIGGLGNQMFQYAFGRHLALLRGTALKLDVSAFHDGTLSGNFTPREFQLDLFNIRASIASEEDLKKFETNRRRKVINHLALHLPVKMKYHYLREPYFHFFKKALSAPENTYVSGNWQSEKYFLPVRKQLLGDFTAVRPLSNESNIISDKIKKCNAVSIHVRRGDYVSNEKNKNIYVACNEEYYKEAIRIISAKIPDPVFFVFSDEPEWFKDNVSTAFPVHIISHNTGNAGYEDMLLMSLCKHNIIANSSFSWWGAWLNQHTDKNVIAPANWFKDSMKNTKDLLPETWIRI